jgi:N-succinyl-L-ornithine transcarbamylase
VEAAYKNADFIYAKNWSKFRDPDYGKVVNKDRNWTVDARKMKLTNNAKFMQLPACKRNMM